MKNDQPPAYYFETLKRESYKVNNFAWPYKCIPLHNLTKLDQSWLHMFVFRIGCAQSMENGF